MVEIAQDPEVGDEDGRQAVGPAPAAEGASPGETTPTAEEQTAEEQQPGDDRPAGPVGTAAGETGAGRAEPIDAADPSAGPAAGRVLLDHENLQRRWRDVQVSFVDEPRQAVQEADSLVRDALRELTDALSAERSGIERDWNAGRDTSTEDYRVALVRYRDFVQRLASV